MITHIHVRARSARSSQGFITCGQRRFACIIGRAGRVFQKREGDGASPIGVWKLGSLYFRRDRLRAPPSELSAIPLQNDMGWCDDPQSALYNRLIKLPYAANHEDLFRADSAYDILVTTDHNSRPWIKGFGSAIFFHLTRPDSTVTAGCVAVSKHDMRLILAACGPKTKLVIWPATGDLRLDARK
jgi:L,D-peptidoglycan transpeptidase YkuD (ErfK/YbiS/YcfS/YnhG family)